MTGFVDAAAAATQKAVKKLLFGECQEKAAAVEDIRRLAAGDGRRKRLLAALGVIPPLVSMLDEFPDDDRRRRTVVEALIELANGTFKNKALMVEAGLLGKLPKLMNSTQDLSKNKDLAFLLHSISSLARTPFSFASSDMLPFLTQILRAKDMDDELKSTCVSTLYNLSTKLENVQAIVSSGAPGILLALSQNKKSSEGALATLGNLLLSESGKRAIEEDSLVPEILMEIMAWDDKPKSQELAAYLLMVVAHRNKFQRNKMAELGIVPLLLQVALLGSPLAQERALKMLQWFKVEAQTRRRGHSGPQAERGSSSSSCSREIEVRECRRAVKRMVRQSLDKNLEVIVRRAHASEDFSSLKGLVSTSSSKSLPY